MARVQLNDTVRLTMNALTQALQHEETRDMLIAIEREQHQLTTPEAILQDVNTRIENGTLTEPIQYEDSEGFEAYTLHYALTQAGIQHVYTEADIDPEFE